MLFGRQLKLFHPDPFEIYSPANLNVQSRKINNILNHCWNRLKIEYLKLQKFNSPQIQLKGAVIVEEERESKSMWKVGIVEELLQGKYGQIGGAKL